MQVIKRKINGIEIAVDPYKANRILFNKNVIEENNVNIAHLELKDLLSFLTKQGNFTPLYLKWEITSRCNKDCPFCYIHNHTNDIELDFDQNKKIIDFLYEKGLFFVCMTGGECTLYKDFKKMYLYLKKKGILVEVYSNGINISPEVIQMFKEYMPYRVEITLYDMDEKILKTILALKKEKINIVAKCTVNNSTICYFDAIKQWCENNSIPFYFSTEVFNAYDDTDMSQFNLDEQEKCRVDKIRYKDLKMKYGRKRCLSCGAGRYALSLRGENLDICPHIKTYDKSVSLELNYQKIVKYIHMYKNQDIIGCEGCECFNLCKMCIARALKNGIEIKVPDGYCEKINLYAKEIGLL